MPKTASSQKNFLQHWTVAAFVVVLGVVGTLTYAIVYFFTRCPCDGQGVPMISTAVFLAPGAREGVVVLLLCTAFLAHRCANHAVAFLCWVWIFSFLNQANDTVHFVYVVIAGNLTAFFLYFFTSLPVWFKVVLALSHATIALVVLSVDSCTVSPWYFTEYVFLALLFAGYYLATRDRCQSADCALPLL